MTPHTRLPLHVRLEIAKHMANAFFPLHSDKIKAGLGKPNPPGNSLPLALHEFIEYLKHTELVEDPWVIGTQIAAVADDLTRAGLLNRMPGSMPPPFGDCFYAMSAGVTKAQAGGDLWLSRALGPEFLIRSFMPAAVAVVGTCDGRETAGTGLLLDDRHVLTNRHVVSDMSVEFVETSSAAPPTAESSSVTPVRLKVTDINAHDMGGDPDKNLDVAIIEVTGVEGVSGLADGVAFRDPEWSDSVWTFGYPSVPMTRELSLLVHSGGVVNPEVVDYSGNKLLLFSAVARPGNSGGPIVAADGRVVGIVAQELRMDKSLESPFYAGVPTHEIQRALVDMGYTDLLNVELWQSLRD
ncbi:serine protease [Rhodococcus sp. IEGM 1330]|uniref:S1 family peptidase n=1 Tax=Rhodococcus sp. IEGM 1330 TaxID=3082225 RepID=UPI002952FD79|nr:serine protease [Rhodococcus sp. IEGM 1330]MDV8021372.1 serine protease [Rhodococcus sp. IEGM 1330]